MAKRTKKLSKTLRLEALEQRQLLAGGFTTAQGQEFSDITHSNGNVYDQVLLKSSAISLTNDAGQITRVSFLDLNGDIVQAEFSGAGTLSISLDSYTGAADPENYVQPGIQYVKGLATFTIQGSDATTNFSVYTVGSATPGVNSSLFDATHTGGDHLAEVQRVTVVADPSNPNGSIMGGIRAANVVFTSDSGVVGITAANVQIQNVVRIGDIDAKGSATPALTFGANSQFGAVEVAGGDLAQTNAKLINNSGSYAYQVSAIANADSSGTAMPAKAIATGLFSDKDPLTQVNRTFTLTTGVDTFTGGTGPDVFTADNTTTGNFSAADTLNGGEGTDSLTIFGSAGSVGIIKNIENLTVDSMAAAGTWNLSSATGMQTLLNSRAAGASTVSVPDGVAVTLSANAADTLQTVNFGGNDTAASLTLNTVATSTTGVTVGGAKVATLNLVTAGSASTIGTLTTVAATKTLNVTGDQNLTITNALNAAVAKVDASAFTGKLSVVAGNVVDDGTAAVDVTLIGGTNNDTLSIVGVAAATETSVSGGAGDDTIKVASAQIGDKTDVLDGGEGTDVLSVDFQDAAADPGTDLSANIKGIESITLTSDATAVRTHTWAEGSIKSGVTSFTVNGDAADSFALTGLKADSAVKVSSNAAAVSVNGTGAVNVTLDGTTLGTLNTNSYETVNLTSNKDSGDAANALTTGTLSSAKTVTLGGAKTTTLGTVAMAAGASFDATAFSGDLTVAFGSSVKSFIGGSGKDTVTLLTGDLKQGNSFAGGAGDKDALTVTANSAQDMGLVAVTGFETVNVTANAAAADTVTADFRNSTGISTLNVASGAGDTDNFTLNRLDAATTLKFGSNVGNVVTTIQTGTAQKIAFGGNYTVGSLTLDSGTTDLTITSDDGDSTENEAGGVVGAMSGTSLTKITVAGKDATNLGTLGATVKTVDASAAKGALTVTTSATATTVTGSQVADTITGAGGDDVIQGGKGADALNGGAGSDQYVFEAKGSDNGTDTITLAVGAAGDKLQFKNFLAGGAVDQNGGAGTGIVAYSTAAVNDVNISGKLVLLTDGAAGANVDTAAEVAALIQGAGNVFSLDASGKAVIIAGNASAADGVAHVYYIDNSLDGSADITAADIVKVAVTAGNLDLDTIASSNVLFV